MCDGERAANWCSCACAPAACGCAQLCVWPIVRRCVAVLVVRPMSRLLLLRRIERSPARAPAPSLPSYDRSGGADPRGRGDAHYRRVHRPPQALGSSKGCGTRAEAAKVARGQLRNGEALAAFRRMVMAQGGDPAVVDALAASPHGIENSRGVNGGEMVVIQGVYGSGTGSPVARSELATAPGPHPPCWGPPVHGYEECRDTEAFFAKSLSDLSEGSAPAAPMPAAAKADAPNAKRAAISGAERSVKGAHGPPVARVVQLDALAVGQACVAIGAGRQALGEAVTMGAGVLLHRKLGAALREGELLFTLFAEVGGSASTKEGPRRVIAMADIDIACRRLIGAFTFGTATAADGAASANRLFRCFVDRDGSVTRLDA